MIPTLIQHHNTSLDYHKMKALAISNQPLVTEIPLSSIEFAGADQIRIDGKLVLTHEKAYKKLLQNVLSVNPEFVKRYGKTTDEKTKLNMLSIFKSGLAIKSNNKISIIADSKTGTITGFSTGKRFMTNEILFELFEQIMNRYGSLKFKEMIVKPNGSVYITSRTSEETSYMSNEEFLGGITFNNDLFDGTQLSHNAFRQICSNGMFGFSDINLNLEKGATGLTELFSKLDKLSTQNFMAQNFERVMKEKMSQTASVREMLMARDTMLVNSDLNTDTINSFLPYDETKHYLAKHKIDIDEMTGAQKINCPTQLNAWDLINIVTDFGSHDYGLNADFARIQGTAGRLFSKKSDSKNFMVFYA